MDLAGFKLRSWSQESQSEVEPVPWWLSPWSDVCSRERSGLPFLPRAVSAVAAVEVTERPLKSLSPPQAVTGAAAAPFRADWGRHHEPGAVPGAGKQRGRRGRAAFGSWAVPGLDSVPGAAPGGAMPGDRSSGAGSSPVQVAPVAEEGNGHQDGIRKQKLTLAAIQPLAAKSL